MITNMNMVCPECKSALTVTVFTKKDTREKRILHDKNCSQYQEYKVEGKKYSEV